MDRVEYSSQFLTPEKFDQLKNEAFPGRTDGSSWHVIQVSTLPNLSGEYEAMLRENNSELESIPLLGSYRTDHNHFADKETCPRLRQHVAGSNAYVFQCVHEFISPNTVNENIQQLLQVIRTLRAHRAKSITVVTPYYPYSRQDKPSFLAREATLASLFSDQLKIAGANIHLTYHPHALSLYGFYEPEMMLVALSGLDLFLDIFSQFKGRDDVVAVSTDAGGAKMTVHFSDAMDIPYAIANKFRPGDCATSSELSGTYKRQKQPLLPMMSDRPSIINACRWLLPE